MGSYDFVTGVKAFDNMYNISQASVDLRYKIANEFNCIINQVACSFKMCKININFAVNLSWVNFSKLFSVFVVSKTCRKVELS